MKVHTFKTVEELIVAMADRFVAAAKEAVSNRGAFHVVLSGGSSPEALYKKLASPAYADKVDWEKVYFFFGDERNVPADDPQYNGLMAKRVLFDPLQIDASHIFYVDTSTSADDAAAKYMDAISTHFNHGKVVFDMILLGLGDDAHTASLFPHTKALQNEAVSVVSNFLEQKNIYRITMTAPMINQARSIAFLVYGKGKTQAVKHIHQDAFNPAEYPAQLIKTASVEWYLDADAASELK